MGIVKGGGADRDRATDPILELNQCVHARTFATGGGFHLPVSASDLGHRRPLFWDIILYCHPFRSNSPRASRRVLVLPVPSRRMRIGRKFVSKNRRDASMSSGPALTARAHTVCSAARTGRMSFEKLLRIMGRQLA
jgi:hypothetical protein